MKILVIEDETMPANFLVRKLRQIRPDAEIQGVTRNIRESVGFLLTHSPYLIFADIRLEDGLSFGIFSRVKTDAAVVFTTSYNEYAIKAFEYNCIDYLLKPVTDEGISRALEKFDRFHTPLSISVLQAAVAQMGSGTQSWRRRLLIGRGASIAVVPTENIACICIEFGYATVYLKDGSSGLLDMRLDDLAAQLDPERFMKISRQCIVSLDSVTGILPLPENRLSLVLCTPDRKEVTVTRSHTAQLKSRLDR